MPERSFAAILLLAGFTSAAAVALEREAAPPSRPADVWIPLGQDQEPAQAIPAEFASLTLDELIERLPLAGCELLIDTHRFTASQDAAACELQRRLTSGATLTAKQWQAAIRRTQAVRHWERWPAGTPFAISMIVPHWLGIAEIRLRSPQESPLRGASAGELLAGWSGTGASIREAMARYQELGELPSGRHHVVFDVEIEKGRSWMDSTPLPADPVLARFRYEFDVDVVDSIDRAIPPVQSAALDRAVARSIGAGVRSWADTEGVPYVAVDPDFTRTPDLADVALSLDVEIVDKLQGRALASGELVASRLDPYAILNSTSQSSLRLFGSANLAHVSPAAMRLDRLGTLTLRIRGNDRHLLGLWDAHRRWDGTIEMPLAQAILAERARTGPQGRAPEMGTPRPR